ncbi:MxaK protein [Candidatus Methylocalor cossyra]|uniref:MxaK protein n=1 Tax=Candidatus Methylocalor cossyra TaxID=3108543 RepID=A0ABM9NEQ7_9GAMM
MERLNLGWRAALWGGLAVLLAGALHEGFAWYRTARENWLSAAPAQFEVTPETAPALVFAKAYQLAAAGHRQEAQRLYGTLLGQGDGHWQAKVRYNLGTLYLQQAAELWNAKGVLEYIRVNTLLAAAKDHLREALRLEPELWDARFNLEYAERITPPPKEKPKADFQGSKSSVFATLPSLPGGGP